MDAARSLILFVDDQQVARRYFSMMFGSEYDIITADNAEEAWMLIQAHADRLAVVITDQRMGQHTGVDLLMAVRQKHPRMVRLLTTGYGDLDEAIDAVHRGDLHAYIQKPWNIEEFGLDIRRAVALYDLQCERDSLLDVQARALRHTFAADRLRAYGLIAATCSAWIHHAVSATLAFWNDGFRHHLGAPRAASRAASTESDSWPSSSRLGTATTDHTRAMINAATEAGVWLHAVRDAVTEPTDVAQLVASVANEAHITVRHDAEAVRIPVHVAFLKNGLHALLDFFRSSAALHGREAVPVIALSVAHDGGLNCSLRWLIGPADDRQPLPSPPIVESQGWKAYIAIHHHGGTIAIREWGPERGLIDVHLPLRSTVEARPRESGRADATAALVAAITQFPPAD